MMTTALMTTTIATWEVEALVPKDSLLTIDQMANSKSKILFTFFPVFESHQFLGTIETVGNERAGETVAGEDPTTLAIW